ncbi:hypothetical protein IHE61_21855 [Streptomyces sp. GKU 257-1]|nr:hypothetical protein [Streptomyces sp. GKU 257-1]
MVGGGGGGPGDGAGGQRGEACAGSVEEGGEEAEVVGEEGVGGGAVEEGRVVDEADAGAGDVEEEVLLAGGDGRAETAGRGVVEGELVEGRYAGQAWRREESDEALEGDVEPLPGADGRGGSADEFGAVRVAGEVGPPAGRAC